MCITEIYITKQNNLNTDIQYPRLMKHSNLEIKCFWHNIKLHVRWLAKNLK